MSFQFKPIHSLTGFETVDRLYQTAFGQSSVPTAIQFAWWNQYSEGMWAIFHDDVVIGAMSCYPIDALTYWQIRKGEIREKDIYPEKVSITTLYGFYWSELVVLPEYRKQHLAKQLITSYWQHHYAFQNYPVLAMAYSEAGANVLQSQGFSNVLSAHLQPDHMDVWEKK